MLSRQTDPHRLRPRAPRVSSVRAQGDPTDRDSRCAVAMLRPAEPAGAT